MPGESVNLGDPNPPDVSLLAAGNKRLIGVFLGAEMALQHARVHPMIQRQIQGVERGSRATSLRRPWNGPT